MQPDTYIDGFVAAVPTQRRDEYRRHAVDAARVFKKHGALTVVEGWGDEVPEGKLTSFSLAVQRKPDEAIATLRGIQVDPSLREVVDERLAQLFNATGKPEEALKLLEGDAGSTALELRGDALLASGNCDQARDA